MEQAKRNCYSYFLLESRNLTTFVYLEVKQPKRIRQLFAKQLSHAWCYSQTATIPNDTPENYYNSQLLQLSNVLKGFF